MKADEPFTWSTPASAFLRALMNEVEAYAAHDPPKPTGRSATLKQLVDWEKKVAERYDACEKARIATWDALEALRGEMQEEVWGRG